MPYTYTAEARHFADLVAVLDRRLLEGDSDEDATQAAVAYLDHITGQDAKRDWRDVRDLARVRRQQLVARVLIEARPVEEARRLRSFIPTDAVSACRVQWVADMLPRFHDTLLLGLDGCAHRFQLPERHYHTWRVGAENFTSAEAAAQHLTKIQARLLSSRQCVLMPA